MAGGVELDEFAGDLAHSLAGFALGVLPIRAAQFRQRRCFATDIAGKLVERVHRHVQLVAGLAALARGVLDDEVFAARPRHCALDHLDEPADAVLVVHHEVTRGQRQRVDLVAALGTEPATVARARHPRAGQVGLGDDDERRGRGGGTTRDQTAPQGSVVDRDGVGHGRLTGGGHRRRDFGLTQAFVDALGRALARDDDRRAPTVADVGTQLGE